MSAAGLRSVLDQMEAILARHGVERVGAVGDPFDPERHDAVGVRVTDETPDRTVVGCRPLGLRDRRTRLAACAGDRVRRSAGRLMAVAFRATTTTCSASRGASDADIRKAYRALARKHHPDVNKDADAKDRFTEISEAYEVLRDPDKRERYDRWDANGRRRRQRRLRLRGLPPRWRRTRRLQRRRREHRVRRRRLLRSVRRAVSAAAGAPAASRASRGAGVTRRRCSS